MKIALPDTNGMFQDYALRGTPLKPAKLGTTPARVVFAAAHVVADPFTASDPTGPATVDFDATMTFRRYLADMGLGIAEAMDTSQRGMGLDWPGALELIRRTRAEIPDALVFNGVGTDQLAPLQASGLDDIRRAYMEQLEAVQSIGGRVILMASRELARLASGPGDYLPDQDLLPGGVGAHRAAGSEGRARHRGQGIRELRAHRLKVIEKNQAKVDGIKISLLDKDKEITMRRRLPSGVKMYTGDDFNYPELIEGDEEGFSHALLGIFDPLAAAAADAVSKLGEGDHAGFRATLDPTVPLARLIFRAPTQYYKTGVVFLAWLNGFQDHFVMLGGAQAMRPLPYFTEAFKLADGCGLLRDPELAVNRMKRLLSLYGQ
jgi:hypothetical protein